MSEFAGPQPPQDDAEGRPESGWPGEADPARAVLPLSRDPAATVAPAARRSGGLLSRRRSTLVLSALVVLLAGAAGWAFYAMHTDEQRSVLWQRRAHALQANAVQLESLVAARTRLLNQRIDQMNALARKLKGSESALSVSQGDVSSLEARQRELANEKAQLQDQQRQLDQVASAYVTCKNDLIQLLSDVANGNDTTFSYDTANTDCSSADDSLQSYSSAYPNG